MTTTPRVIQAAESAIQQRVTSTNFFDGTTPAGDAPLDKGFSTYKYTASTAGGLFWWNTVDIVICSQFHISLGGSGNITVNLVNLDPTSIASGSPTILAGETMTIEAATAVTFLALDESKFKTLLLPYQAIQLITTASGAAQIAQLVGSLAKAYVR